MIGATIFFGKLNMASWYMAVVSGLAGLVLAGPVFTVIFGTAQVQIMNNE